MKNKTKVVRCRGVLFFTKNTASGVSFRGVLFSGNANNGANAGFVYANTNNTATNTNANIGSQLCL